VYRRALTVSGWRARGCASRAQGGVPPAESARSVAACLLARDSQPWRESRPSRPQPAPPLDCSPSTRPCTPLLLPLAPPSPSRLPAPLPFPTGRSLRRPLLALRASRRAALRRGHSAPRGQCGQHWAGALNLCWTRVLRRRGQAQPAVHLPGGIAPALQQLQVSLMAVARIQMTPTPPLTRLAPPLTASISCPRDVPIPSRSSVCGST
jgi:hypothetical protein